MKTLKDVYIKVTDKNRKELGFILHIYTLQIGDIIVFTSDELKCVDFRMSDEIEGLFKVSLSELKKLIETIPTREEITRLKRQISAYKTNYDKVVKHSLSKEDVIEELDNAVAEQKKIITRQINEIHKLKEEIDSISYEKSFLSSQYYVLKEENERLKNKKWYQIWK